MNIQSINAAYGSMMYEVTKRSDSKSSVPAQQTNNKGERVEISNESSQLQQVKEAVDVTPEVRIEIVEKIKARIKANDYPIENNLNEVVKKMLQSKILHPY